MKTAMNIQMATQESTGQNENNNKMEAAIMTVQNHIQGIVQNKTQILAGIVVGGMMAVAFMLPGNASADNSARPLSQVESSVFVPASSTANVIDMDFLEPGFYDAKLARTSSVWESDGVDPYENVEFKSVISNTGSAMDLDLLDPGVYDAKLARASSVWESDGVDPYENVEFKSVRTGGAMDMDLLDPGVYSLVNTSSDIEGLRQDNII
jgi:hypothetical protein